MGLTGGIGTGKTLVAAIFHSFGVPIYKADERAKALMAHSGPLKKKSWRAWVLMPTRLRGISTRSG